MIWFFIIVAIIIVAAGSVWWLQHYFQTRIKDLDEKVEAIDIGALSSQIRSIEQLKLTGDSLATFGKWERAFDQLNDHDLAELQKILLDLEDQVKRFRLDRASKIAKVLEDKIETAQRQYELISQALQDIRHDEADNRSKMLQLRDDYQVSRKTILAKSFVFGDAQPALEQQLQQLAQLFQKIDQINNDGDHQAAKSEIKQLAEQMRVLKKQVKELPPLVNEQVNEFPGQINEIQHGYRLLTTAHYVFSDDIPGMVADVEAKMKDANAALKSIDVEATEAANAEIEAEIDKMYAIMEKEMLIVAGLAAAVLLYGRTRRLNELEQEYKRARDDSRELTLMLEKKNQDLLEKQDTEVYLATLKERNRIAREIHDNVGHMLSRSILMVGALKTVNQDENLKVPMELLDQTLNEAMTNVRQSVHDLHDESVNLKEVMESLAEEFRFCPVQFTYDMGYDIPKEIKYSFIAITKEALNNVMRHSNANEVKILAREHPGLYQLIIEDNGTSNERIRPDGDREEYAEKESAGKTGNDWKTENTESSGIGIENMKERVRMLGGTMQIQKETGFRIFITVPKNEGKR